VKKGKIMTDRERLLEILNVPIYPHENVDPLEAVADYLLDNGVTIPKRGHWIIHSNGRGNHATNWAECSECHGCGSPQWKVCPVCETKMEDT
jgi:hypothetical protein